MGAVYDAAAAPVGRSAFAGEHPHPAFPTTVHGAYRSGRRAAREVLHASA